MARTRRRSVPLPAGAPPTEPDSPQAYGTRDEQRGLIKAGVRGGRPRWIPAIAVATVLLVSLVAWRILPAFGDDPVETAVQPIATLNAPDVHSLLIDPVHPDRVLFGSHAGVQESLDGGITWQPGTLRNVDAMSMTINPMEATTLYVTGHDVFLTSIDGGETWGAVAHDLPGTDIHAFAQDPNDPRRLYALVVGSGVLTSADAGKTWTSLPTQPPGVANHGALATDGQMLFATTMNGLTVTRDGGKTWEPTAAQPAGDIISLTISGAASDTLYAGTLDGIARSTDEGTSWVTIGPAGVPVLALAIAPAEPNRVLVVSENGALYRSDDGGTSWTSPQ